MLPDRLTPAARRDAQGSGARYLTTGPHWLSLCNGVQHAGPHLQGVSDVRLHRRDVHLPEDRPDLSLPRLQSGLACAAGHGADSGVTTDKWSATVGPFASGEEPGINVLRILAWAEAAQRRSHESQQRAAAAGIHLRKAMARSDAWFTHYAHPRATTP